MININGKNWFDLSFEDVEVFVQTNNDESFFLEFKSDEVNNKTITKEICAFANSFGGYLIIGITDDKEIVGVKKWSEQRIHTLIHDSISPIPIFDVKELHSNNRSLLVIKVEEGNDPPYIITSTGSIYERVSSGSYPINDVSGISLLLDKRHDQLKTIEKKIELPPIIDPPTNYCGCIDMGFSLFTRESFDFTKRFYDIDSVSIANYIKEQEIPYSFSRVANSYVITIGRLSNEIGSYHTKQIPAGVIFMLEIMDDGSVRTRLPLILPSSDDDHLNVMHALAINSLFREIYSRFVGDLLPHMLYAYKYEMMHVYRQFIPVYDVSNYEDSKVIDFAVKKNKSHAIKYGDNIIPLGHRIPHTGYTIIDQREFDKRGIEYNSKNLIECLFYMEFLNFGFIDE